MKEACIFCKIIKGELPSNKIYEDENFYAFLDNNPVNKGHTLIIPKEHHDNMNGLPFDLGNDLLEITQNISNAVVEAVDADGYNFNVNNGEAAGQEVFHTHFHIIPRFESDNKIKWKNKEDYEEGEAEELEMLITSNLK